MVILSSINLKFNYMVYDISSTPKNNIRVASLM